MSVSGNTVSNCSDPLGIEVGLAPLGCILNIDEEIIGKVFLCKTSEDQTSGQITWTNVGVYFDGRPQEIPYTGTISACPNDSSCGGPITDQGVQTTWGPI